MVVPLLCDRSRRLRPHRLSQPHAACRDSAFGGARRGPCTSGRSSGRGACVRRSRRAEQRPRSQRIRIARDSRLPRRASSRGCRARFGDGGAAVHGGTERRAAAVGCRARACSRARATSLAADRRACRAKHCARGRALPPTQAAGRVCRRPTGRRCSRGGGSRALAAQRAGPAAAADPVVRGWLELAALAAAAARNPTSATPEIDAWRARNPNHPANAIVRTELLGQQVQPVEVAPHVALLLPITGRQAAAAISVRDGFMTAYYQTPAAQRPRVRIYDTGENAVADVITRATQQGAEFVVGPLTRDEVTAVAELAAQRPPILALNFLPPERPVPAMFYQFALSPEDEARLVARRILGDGHRQGVVVAPAGDWGTRVFAAFKQEIEAGGGTLLATAAIDTSQTDYSEAITQVLRISDSRARHRRIESILGTKLQFEPRRRSDIEFVFAPAQANTERLLRPQLRFHYAGDIPTYATSEAFEPDPRSNEDLEGLIFPDMPWMLGGDLADAVRAATRDAWPNGGPRRSRLFAFGFDAYRLALALRDRGVSANIDLEGLTGRLNLDTERRVRRELAWAQLHNGEIHILPAAAH
ncbi:MAG: penicillin-binding protein activator [Gammaproteobacteria bacterium]|nr:MAG: penicillin-binding protein activator [Gammaproteobacteria bacterium]